MKGPEKRVRRDASGVWGDFHILTTSWDLINTDCYRSESVYCFHLQSRRCCCVINGLGRLRTLSGERKVPLCSQGLVWVTYEELSGLPQACWTGGASLYTVCTLMCETIWNIMPIFLLNNYHLICLLLSFIRPSFLTRRAHFSMYDLINTSSIRNPKRTITEELFPFASHTTFRPPWQT